MRLALVRCEGSFDAPAPVASGRVSVSWKRSHHDDPPRSDCFGDAPKSCQHPQINLVVLCLRD
jgi:hypothetical protein